LDWGQCSLISHTPRHTEQAHCEALLGSTDEHHASQMHARTGHGALLAGQGAGTSWHTEAARLLPCLTRCTRREGRQRQAANCRGAREEQPQGSTVRPGQARASTSSPPLMEEDENCRAPRHMRRGAHAQSGTPAHARAGRSTAADPTLLHMALTSPFSRPSTSASSASSPPAWLPRNCTRTQPPSARNAAPRSASANAAMSCAAPTSFRADQA